MDVHAIPRPERPHRNTPTGKLRDLLRIARSTAQKFAESGPKEDEDIVRMLADEYRDELQRRGELRPRNEEPPCTG